MEEHVENIKTEKSTDVFSFLKNIDYLLHCNTRHIDLATYDLIDEDILEEIRNIASFGITHVYFGKSLRDIKVVIEDDELRKHELCVQYKSRRKLVVSSVKLPHSSMQNREYVCLGDIVDIFRQCVNDLAKYFYELENMDHSCAIMEPLNATFKDDYRSIFLDERTWLYVQVTSEGLASNIHLIGQSEYWHNKLQSGLLDWDHDKNIVDNITTIFDLSRFPQPAAASKCSEVSQIDTDHTTPIIIAVECGICLCTHLPNAPGMPLPLCQNPLCGVYYHRNCLYQWLVACAGSRAPAFGVANGACPTCLQPIACSEKEN